MHVHVSACLTLLHHSTEGYKRAELCRVVHVQAWIIRKNKRNKEEVRRKKSREKNKRKKKIKRKKKKSREAHSNEIYHSCMLPLRIHVFAKTPLEPS